MNFLPGFLNSELKSDAYIVSGDLTSAFGVRRLSPESQKVRILSVLFCAFSFIFFFSPYSVHANGLQRVPSSLGLIGYWSFNEGTSTIAYDASGNGNNGVLTNISNPSTATSGWRNGKFGKAIFFDGVDDLVTVSNSSSIQFSGKFSVSVWVKTSGLNSTAQTNFIKTVSSFPTTGWALLDNGPSSAEIVFRVSPAAAPGNCTADGTTCFSRSLINDGQWHNIVGVYDNTDQIRLYLDGVEQDNGNPGTFTNNNTGLRIAQFQGSGGGGIEDEVRLYNRALSASEIATLYNTSAVTRKTVSNQGLKGYWPLDEGSGFTIYDVSGNHNDGVLLGTMGWGQGRRGGALKAADSNGWASSSIKNPFDLYTSPQTVNMWYRQSTSGANLAMLTIRDGAGTGGYHMAGGAGDVAIARWGGGYVMNLASSTTQYGQWGMLTFTYDGTYPSGYRMYDNGKLVSSTVVNGLASVNAEQIIFSGYGVTNDGRFTAGDQIDDVRLYNRVLSPEEVAALYSAGQQNIAKTQTGLVTNGLVGYWPFDGRYVNWGTGKALDASGNANDGNFIGLATTTSVTTGRVGQALRFNGTSSYISAGSNPSITDVGSMSVCAWIRPRANPPGYWAGIASKSTGSASNGWQFYIYGSNPPYGLGFMNNDGDAVEKDPAPITLNEWQHVCGVWDGNSGLTGRKLYLNGAVLTGTSLANYAGASSDSSYSLGIGTLGAAPYLFSGDIDEVRVYDRNITAQEVQQLYSAGR